MPKLPKGPKPARANPAPRTLELDGAQESRLGERIASIVLARLRAEVPHLFTQTQPPA